MVLLEQECYRFMTKGTSFQKLKTKKPAPTATGRSPGHFGGKKFARTFKLDSSHKFISWTPSRKAPRYAQYEIRRIAKIKRGLTSWESDPELFKNYSGTGLTLVFTNGTTCELVASNQQAVDFWVTGLRFLIYRIQQNLKIHLSTEKERFLRTEFKNKSYGAQNLDSHSAIELLHDVSSIAPFLDLQTKLRTVFNEDRLISCNQFVAICDDLTSVDILLSLIFQYNINGDPVLNSRELALVMSNEVSNSSYGVANENQLMTFCQNVISSFEPIPEYKQNELIGIDGLTAFFLSQHCGMLDPRHQSVHQDMSRPLSQYFINSSHNTYLTGTQLLGDSSADMYSQLLLKGVRYVDIDVWDGDDGQPYCNHGYTLTSRIPFTHVIQAINQSAFVTSVYPVIIALENHCSLTQQESLVQTMMSVFREKLFLPKDYILPSSNSTVTDLPLNSLCCKILLKCKKLKIKTPSIGRSRIEPGSVRSSFSSKSGGEAAWGEVSDENSADEINEMYKVQPGLKRNNMNEIVEDLKPYDQRRKQHLLQGKSPTIALSLGLSKCVALRSNTINKQTIRKLTEAPSSETDEPKTPTKKPSSASIYNLPENQAVHLVREQYVEVLSFSQSNLVCVTPSPTRIDSSNPELLQFWNAGIQIVALNQQSEDRILKMNDSLFISNGNCGYFLKHQLLNRDSMTESPDYYCTKTVSLSFHYLSILGPNWTNQVKPENVTNQKKTGNATNQSNTENDQSQTTSTYSIRIEFQGHPADNSSHIVDCKGPEVMREGVKNVKLAYPDLAFVTIAIIDGKVHSRRSLADYCVPVNSLAHGLRSVRLTGKLPAFLLCDVRIDEHVQPMKNVQSSTGLFKRASNLRRSLRTSLRKPPSLAMPPPNLPTSASIPEIVSSDRCMEALSDKDSGFMSINSSINSPSRIENNPSPTNSGNGPPTGVTYIPQIRHSRSTDFPQSPRFFDEPQKSQKNVIDQDRVNIMLEEAAKAEVLISAEHYKISAEHRKAKSLSITEEMLVSDGTNFAPVPPKRAQSFRDKASLSALESLTLKPQNQDLLRDQLELDPNQLSTTLPNRNSIHAQVSPSYFKKPPSNFLYTVSSPTRENLYRVVEESNPEDTYYRPLSSNGMFDQAVFMNETFASPTIFQSPNSRNVAMNMSWDPSFDPRNNHNQPVKNNKHSRYINASAVGKVESDYMQPTSESLSKNNSIRTRPWVPPKPTIPKDFMRPPNLDRTMDSTRHHSFIDTFTIPHEHKMDRLDVDTSWNTTVNASSTVVQSAQDRTYERSDLLLSGEDSPDMSAREGSVNLHEMSRSLPVESVYTSNAVKKSLKTLNNHS